MSVVFFVDNRIITTDDVQSEASFAAHFRFVERFIQNYIIYSESNGKWLSYPLGLVVAASADRTQFIPKSNISYSNIGSLIEPKYYCSPNQRFRQTWEKFLVDGFTSIVRSGLAKSSSGRHNTVKILIFGVADALLHTSDAEEKMLISSVRQFCTSFSALCLSSIDFEIVCVQTRDIGKSVVRSQSLLIEREIRTVMNIDEAQHERCHFSMLINASLYFEEQLRKLLTEFRSAGNVKLKFPSLVDQNCSVIVSVVPITLQGVDFLLHDIGEMDFFSHCKRDGIHPACIGGVGFVAKTGQIDVEEGYKFASFAYCCAKSNVVTL
jgi:hypothetical protein